MVAWFHGYGCFDFEMLAERVRIRGSHSTSTYTSVVIAALFAFGGDFLCFQ